MLRLVKDKIYKRFCPLLVIEGACMAERETRDGIHGFTLVSKKDLPEQNGTGSLFKHDATGFEIYKIANADPENVFGFVFKTPPKNSYGTPHIIEHSVLAGSRSYPTKDPFLELMKGSANTFLNAMTYPDKTIYPAASPLKKDFYNLFSVYADAVFFPLLRKETFKQEGIRVTLDPKGELSYDGIVFNEMKGAYSDHDSIVAEHSIRSLFPDTPYGFDSGGDPTEIINLTYEQFTGFHAEFYHPSNGRLYLYGDIPIDELLQFLEDGYLKEFTAIKLNHAVADPKVWAAPVKSEYTSPLLKGESPKGKSTITINSVVCSIHDPLDVMTLELLVEILLGNPGAPLYKAIIESGLGSDIASVSGMDSDFKNVVFTVGIRGTDPQRREAFEKLIKDEYQVLLKDGISSELIDQAIHRIEFQHREIRGGIPTGLRVMTRVVRGWLHGLAPEDTLLFEPVMTRLKYLITNCCETGGYLENWIKEHLLNNPHTSVVTVTPHKDHNRLFDEELQKRLNLLSSKMNKKEQRLHTEEQKKFLAFQTTADAPEELAKIPRLTREDLPLEISKFPVTEDTIDGLPCYTQNMFTNGISYLDLIFDVAGIPKELEQLLPLFSRLIYMTGIPGHSYDEVSRMLAGITGGFSCRLEAATDEPKKLLIFRMKMLGEENEQALDLVRKILLTSELWNVKRIKDILLEQRSDFTQSIIPAGSQYAALRASAQISRAAALEDSWKGFGQWFFNNEIDVEDEEAILAIARSMGEIRDRVIVKNRLLINLTCEENSLELFKQQVHHLLHEFPTGSPLSSKKGKKETPVVEDDTPRFYGETFIIPAHVAYTAQAFPASPFGDPRQVYESILTHILRTNHFWEAIRVVGGAYGASASIDVIEHMGTFSSYRDPRVSLTLADYKKSLESIAAGEINAEKVELSVIAIVGKDVRNMSPSEMSFIGFRRLIYGITDALREERRELMLSADTEAIINAAKRLLSALEREQSVVVLCSQDLYEKEKTLLPHGMQKAQNLPL